MRITASKLRENVYRILDECVETGKPVEVVRKGVVLRIVPSKCVSKLADMKKRDWVVGKSDDLIDNWGAKELEKEWLENWDKLVK